MREYLISEIQRFHDENGRIPLNRDMLICNGYPSLYLFTKEFGSWNNAVEAAGFKPRLRVVVGKEVCIICGVTETSCWYNSDDGRVCHLCYKKGYYIRNVKREMDYMNGLLDINSATGFGFLCQRIVAKKLGLELKYDCNCTKGFGHKGFDLLQLDNEKYGRIQVKGSTLLSENISQRWYYGLGDVYECDNYIMLGFTENKSDVKKVWIIPSGRSIVMNKTGLSITLNPKRIRHVAREIVKYEVEPKPYNDVYHGMNLDNCSVLKKY